MLKLVPMVLFTWLCRKSRFCWQRGQATAMQFAPASSAMESTLKVSLFTISRFGTRRPPTTLHLEGVIGNLDAHGFKDLVHGYRVLRSSNWAISGGRVRMHP